MPALFVQMGSAQNVKKTEMGTHVITLDVISSIYLLAAIMFLIPTYFEGVKNGETSILRGALSIMSCVLWPITIIYVLALQKEIIFLKSY